MGRTQANSTTSTGSTTGAIVTPECHMLTVHTCRIAGNFPRFAERLLSFEVMAGPYEVPKEQGTGWEPEPLHIPAPGPRSGSHRSHRGPYPGTPDEEETDDRVGTHVTIIDLA